MERHYTYLGEIFSTYLGERFSNPNWDKFATAIIIGAGMTALGVAFSRRLSSKQAISENIVPGEKATFVGIVDFFLEALVKYQDGIMGPEGRKYFPFTGSVFFFVLFANVLSLIPGIAAATTTVWINVGMSLTVFIYFNYLGVKANGVLGYLKHFCGPMWPIAFILFPVEIISTTLRILTLNLRLYWNISADHIVLATFTGLVPYFPFVGIPFYMLGAFVAFVQALIFATLSMVYISLAVQHEEEH